MTPERRIENQILIFLKKHNVLCWKNETTGIYDPKKKVFRINRNPHKLRGVSDILGVFHGTALAIEVKQPKRYATKEQRLFLELVQQSGGIAFVARSVEDVARELGLSA